MPDSKPSPDRSDARSVTRTALTALPLLAVALVWSYWTVLTEMANKWEHDPQYSHGWLVPVFALALLWLRREMLDPRELRPTWWGLLPLAAGVAVRLSAAHFYIGWLDPLSMIPCIAGIVLLLGGPHALRWSWPAVAFLFFMIPLPYSLETAMQGPLRQFGTVVGTYIMPTAGLPAIAEGNVILVNDVAIGVVEACSGLRMLMIFFALSSAVALLCERPAWQRCVIVFSAVPIALIANITRITVTGGLYAVGYSKLAELVFHDLAGWLMMPLGLGLLWVELWYLSRLFLEDEDRPMTAGLDAEPLGAAPPLSREKVPAAR
jgi:exosortase